MTTQVSDTAGVLEHHLHALGSGDLDAVLDDYTEESLLMTPDGALKGRAAIRAAFEGFLAGPFKPGTYQFFADARTIEGEVAQIVWHANCADLDIVHGVDTFVVRDGKIAVQTYAGKIEPH